MFCVQEKEADLGIWQLEAFLGMMSFPLSDVQLLPSSPFFFFTISLQIANIVLVYHRSLKINNTF
jgi:hypothetical protein